MSEAASNLERSASELLAPLVGPARDAGLGNTAILDAIIAAAQKLVPTPTPRIAAAESLLTQKAKSGKPVRVYFDGCFDIMHSGHFNALRQARELADVLVAGVHSDAEIEKNKGPPVMKNEERMATVRACKWVDELVFDTPYEPSIELLDRLNCDFCVHGDDMPVGASGRGAYDDIRDAGRLRIIKRTEGVSTTDLVGRLLLMTKGHHLPPSPVPAAAPSPEAVEALFSRKASASDTAPLAASSSVGVPAVESPASAATTSVSSGTGNGAAAASVGGASAAGGGPSGVNVSDSRLQEVSNFLTMTRRIQQFSNGRVPEADDTVVYIDGDFDLFHIGHIELLEKAKKLGTFLYVGVFDDAVVNRVKGTNYPIMNLHERVLNVLSCKFVDEVIIGAPWTITADMVKSLNIAKLCKTPFHADPSRMQAAQGLIAELESTRNLTTHDVVQRIIENRTRYLKRNADRAQRELKYIKNREYVQEV